VTGTPGRCHGASRGVAVRGRAGPPAVRLARAAPRTADNGPEADGDGDVDRPDQDQPNALTPRQSSSITVFTGGLVLVVDGW
jgi:hypothetical protein